MKNPIIFLLVTLAEVFGQAPGSGDLQFRIPDQAQGWEWRPQAAQPDGKILVTRSVGFGVPLHLALTRVHRNGSYDATFRPARVVCERVSEAIFDGPVAALQADGKVLVAMQHGHLRLPDGRPVDLLRLQPDGELDVGFAPVPTAFSTEGWALWRTITRESIRLLPEDKILFGMLRLNLDGAVDGAFRPGLPGTLTSFQAEPLSDGRTLVHWQLASGETGFSRLLPDGTRDSTFVAPRTDSVVRQVSSSSEGKLLLAGVFSKVNDKPRNRLARLLPDGSLDESFAPFASAWEQIEVDDLVIQPDGKLILAGRFLREGEAKPVLVIRLNADGKVDETFRAEVASLRYPPGEIEGLSVVYNPLLQPDGGVLLSLSYQRKGAEFLGQLIETIRLHGDGLPYIWPHTFQRKPDGVVTFEITAATNRTVVVEASSDLKTGSWSSLATFPPSVNRAAIQFTNTDGAQLPQQFYRAVAK